MTDRPHLRQVTAWLADLANLTAGTAPLADAKTKIAALASLLAQDYPSGAFERRSLAAVARQCKFFPSYAELCEHLGGWWREHRPPTDAPRLAARPEYDIPKPRDPPTEAERDAVHGIVEAWRMESARNTIGRMLPTAAVRVPAVMSDAQLLATVERTDPNGVRAKMLRAKLEAVKVPA